MLRSEKILPLKKWKVTYCSFNRNKAKLCDLPLGLQHIEQDERVSMGLNGDLHFSHAVERDSRRDYCCFAAFPRIRTIVQKTAMSVIVKTSRCHLSFFVFARALFSSQPSMMQTLILFTEHWSFPASSLISIFIAKLQKAPECQRCLVYVSS